MTHPPKWLVASLLVPFSLYSLVVLGQVGYDGIWRDGLASAGSRQVLADLVVMGLMASLWLADDARRNGRRAVPWVVLTLSCGSLGLLFYLLLSPRRSAS